MIDGNMMVSQNLEIYPDAVLHVSNWKSKFLQDGTLCCSIHGSGIKGNCPERVPAIHVSTLWGVLQHRATGDQVQYFRANQHPIRLLDTPVPSSVQSSRGSAEMHDSRQDGASLMASESSTVSLNVISSVLLGITGSSNQKQEVLFEEGTKRQEIISERAIHLIEIQKPKFTSTVYRSKAFTTRLKASYTMEGKQTGPSEVPSSNFGSGFSDFQGIGDGFSRLSNQSQHQTTVMGAAAIAAVPSRRRSARARDPRLTRASRVASGQTAEGIAAQAGDGSAQISPQEMHISGYSRGQTVEGIAAQAGVGSAQLSPQQMHISGHSRGQTVEGIAAQAGFGSAIHLPQMHISGYRRGQTVEGFAAQAGFGSAWIHPPQMHISGYRRGQTAEGLAAQAGVRSARLPSQQIDLSGHSRGSSSRKRSAGDSTTAPGSRRRRTTYLPSSSGLPILPRSFPVYHTEMPAVEFIIEAPRLTGETCFICKWDTAISPEAGLVEFPQVAVLPCGHCYHDHCLETGTPADQRANPPCLACASKLH